MSVRPMEIRRARTEDAEQVFSLADQLNPANEIDRTAFLAVFPRLLADDHHCCLAALTDDEVRGYASGYLHLALYAQGKVAHLDEMVVEDQLRHSGIGTRLVKAFEEWAIDRDCVLVELATETAGPFYESLGYVGKGGYYRKMLTR